jgi:hypothetical protein
MSDPAKSPSDPLLSEADAVHEKAVRRLQDDVRLADGLDRLARPTHSGPKGQAATPAKLSDPLLYRVNATTPTSSDAASTPATGGEPPSAAVAPPSSDPEYASRGDGGEGSDTLADEDLPPLDRPIQDRPRDPRLLADLEAAYDPRASRRPERRLLGLGLGVAVVVFLGVFGWLWTRGGSGAGPLPQGPTPTAPSPTAPSPTAPSPSAPSPTAPGTSLSAQGPSASATGEPPSTAAPATSTSPRPTSTARPTATARTTNPASSGYAPWHLDKP